MALRRQTIDSSEFQRWLDRSRLFAVLDTCDAPDLLQLVQALPADQVAPLIATDDSELAAAAPYLVQLDPALAGQLFETQAGQPWGILLGAPTDLGTVGTHLSGLVHAAAPDGTPWFFRFYDPRVLPGYFDGATDAELARFFGPVVEYIVPDGPAFVRYQLTASGITVKFRPPSA